MSFSPTPPQEFTQDKPAADPNEPVRLPHVTADRIHRGSSTDGESDWLSDCGVSTALFRSLVRNVDGCGGVQHVHVLCPSDGHLSIKVHAQGVRGGLGRARRYSDHHCLRSNRLLWQRGRVSIPIFSETVNFRLYSPLPRL